MRKWSQPSDFIYISSDEEEGKGTAGNENRKRLATSTQQLNETRSWGYSSDSTIIMEDLERNVNEESTDWMELIKTPTSDERSFYDDEKKEEVSNSKGVMIKETEAWRKIVQGESTEIKDMEKDTNTNENEMVELEWEAGNEEKGKRKQRF